MTVRTYEGSLPDNAEPLIGDYWVKIEFNPAWHKKYRVEFSEYSVTMSGRCEWYDRAYVGSYHVYDTYYTDDLYKALKKKHEFLAHTELLALEGEGSMLDSLTRIVA